MSIQAYSQQDYSPKEQESTFNNLLNRWRPIPIELSCTDCKELYEMLAAYLNQPERLLWQYTYSEQLAIMMSLQQAKTWKQKLFLAADNNHGVKVKIQYSEAFLLLKVITASEPTQVGHTLNTKIHQAFVNYAPAPHNQF